jgi:hypothetical protein
VSPYVRTVRTASGVRAVQMVYSCYRGSRQIGHIGSAHDDAELELLKAVARQRLAAGQASPERDKPNTVVRVSGMGAVVRVSSGCGASFSRVRFNFLS